MILMMMMIIISNYDIDIGVETWLDVTLAQAHVPNIPTTAAWNLNIFKYQ